MLFVRHSHINRHDTQDMQHLVVIVVTMNMQCACTTANLEPGQVLDVSYPARGEKHASSLRTTEAGNSLLPVLASVESSRLKAAAACSLWASQLLSSSPAMTAPHCRSSRIRSYPSSVESAHETHG